MAANAKTIGQEAEKQSFLNRLTRLSLRNKVIGIAILVFLVLLIVSIPGDRNELLARQDRVEAAQVAHELALPAVGPIMDLVKVSLDSAGTAASEDNRYTALSRALTTFGNANSTLDSRFRAVVAFSDNVHRLLEGTNAVAELDTVEFRTAVAEMDTTLGVALLALLEMNKSIDDYNGYQDWISAKLAVALFSLPQGYADPLPIRTRLKSTSLEQ
jgi:hypothetical protein